MFFIIQQFANLIKLLHSENSDGKIALGSAMGFMMAFYPVLSLQAILMLVSVFAFRIQLGAFLLSWLVMSLLLLPFYGFLSPVGDFFLTLEFMRGFYTEMQKSEIFSLTQFNNSVVFGGVVVSIALCFPMYTLFKFLVKKYRVTVLSYLQQTRAYKLFKTLILVKLYGFYEKYEAL